MKLHPFFLAFPAFISSFSFFFFFVIIITVVTASLTTIPNYTSCAFLLSFLSFFLFLSFSFYFILLLLFLFFFFSFSSLLFSYHYNGRMTRHIQPHIACTFLPPNYQNTYKFHFCTFHDYCSPNRKGR